MLARPFDGDMAAIIKPSTVVNGLARAMLKLRPDSSAILMHAPLRDFLITIAKKGIDGRLWARELFLAMRREGLTQNLGFDDEAFFGQTDLQIAASAWLGQQALFASLVGRFPIASGPSTVTGFSPRPRKRSGRDRSCLALS